MSIAKTPRTLRKTPKPIKVNSRVNVQFSAWWLVIFFSFYATALQFATWYNCNAKLNIKKALRPLEVVHFKFDIFSGVFANYVKSTIASRKLGQCRIFLHFWFVHTYFRLRNRTIDILPQMQAMNVYIKSHNMSSLYIHFLIIKFSYQNFLYSTERHLKAI